MNREQATERVEITREAFFQVDAWMERFARGVHETAIRLAQNAGDPGLVTLEIVSDAVRITCVEMASEADGGNEDWSSDGKVRDVA